MANLVEVHSDGINVYVTAKVRTSLLGKIGLTLFNILLLSLFVVFSIALNNEGVGGLIIPTLLMVTFYIFIPCRSWFWNFYGSEYIIINTKTVTRYYNYGIIETTPKTIAHDRMAILFEFFTEINKTDYGHISIVSYSDVTNLPEEILKTTLVFSRSDFDKIEESVRIVFEIEGGNKLSFSVN